MVICSAKHTTFQPTDDQWKCPGCGVDFNFFVIENPDEESADGCVKVHVNDEIRCGKCLYAATGKQTAAKLQKVHHHKVCPTCKGAGTVPEKIANEQ